MKPRKPLADAEIRTYLSTLFLAQKHMLESLTNLARAAEDSLRVLQETQPIPPEPLRKSLEELTTALRSVQVGDLPLELIAACSAELANRKDKAL